MLRYNLKQRLYHFLSCRADSSLSDFLKAKKKHEAKYDALNLLFIRRFAPDSGWPDCSDDITCSKSTADDGTGPSQPHQSAGRRRTRSHNIQPLSYSSSCTHAPTFTSGPKRTGCCRKSSTSDWAVVLLGQNVRSEQKWACTGGGVRRKHSGRGV